MSNATESQNSALNPSAASPSSMISETGVPVSGAIDTNLYIGGDRYYYLRGMIPPSAKKVLDIGCGYGYTFGYLADLSHLELHGLDMDEVALQEARKNYPNVHLLHQTAAELPYPDQSFDVAILSEVIEHVGDENKAFVVGEAYRVLKPGGTFLFTAPFAGAYAWLDPMDVKRRSKKLYGLYTRISGYVPATSAEIGHKHVSMDEINLLFHGKFEIVHIQYCGGVAVPLLTWLTSLCSRFRILPRSVEDKLGKKRAVLSGVKVSPRQAYAVRLTAKRL